MKIRKATRKDLKETAKLIKKEFIKAPYKEKWTIESATKTIRHYLKIGSDVLVAIVNNEVAGFIIYRFECYNNGKACMIGELVVGSDRQRSGIGKSLVGSVEKDCKSRKATSIFLNAVRHAAAFKFYKKMGYSETKDLVQMWRDLK